MRPGDLDEKYLPRAAERVAVLAEGLTARWAALSGRVRGLQDVSLRELDERYAGRGPLALLREVPQVGFVLIAAIFLAGTGTLVTRESQRNRAAAQQTVQGEDRPTLQEDPTVLDTTLGPDVGQRVRLYEAQSAVTVTKALSASDSTRLALVSFAAYRTPAQATRMLSGFAVRRVYLRAKAAGKQAAPLPVDIRGDLGAELRRAYARTAATRLRDQKEQQGYADSISVTTKEEQAYKDDYTANAQAAGIEAREYQRGCACAFAALVEVPSSRVLALRSQGGVRVVEVAAAGLALKDLQVQLLLPEVTTVVPKPQVGPDGR